MFKSAESRYVLRVVLVGVASFLTALQAAGTDSWLDCLIGALVAALGYAGIGAVTAPVEPYIGNKMEPPPLPPQGDAP
jgi:uncharacterized membrane protein YedE/YeeE